MGAVQNRWVSYQNEQSSSDFWLDNHSLQAKNTANSGEDLPLANVAEDVKTGIYDSIPSFPTSRKE